jgi:probable addiction module antidote protein
MPHNVRLYSEWQMARLTKPAAAASFLNAALADSPEMFLRALRKVAQAHQMSRVAKDAGVQRESLYRALSDQGNPRWETFTSVLAAVGLRLLIATPEGLESPAPSPRDYSHILGGISSAERTDCPTEPAPTRSNVVEISQWFNIAPSRQKRQEQDEAANEPTLQEALCR